MKRKFEHIRVLGSALRYMLATRYLPGAPYALPSLPTDIPPHRRLAYAIARASTPADIIQVITSHSAVTMHLWQYGNLRGEFSRQILIHVGDFSETIIKPIIADQSSSSSSSTSKNDMKPAELVPYHELVCIAIEAAKILMEIRAGSIVINRSTGVIPEAAKSPIWVPALAKACKTLRQFGTAALSYDPGEDQKGPGQVETVGNGASNILGSMVRMADEWSNMFGVDTDENGLIVKKEDGRKGSGGLKGIQDLLTDNINNDLGTINKGQTIGHENEHGYDGNNTTLNALEALANHNNPIMTNENTLWSQPQPHHTTLDQGHPPYVGTYQHPTAHSTPVAPSHPDLNMLMNTPPYHTHIQHPHTHPGSHNLNAQNQNQVYMPSERWMIDHNNTPGSGPSHARSSSNPGQEAGNGNWNTYQNTQNQNVQHTSNPYNPQHTQGVPSSVPGQQGHYSHAQFGGDVHQHTQQHQVPGSNVQPTPLDMLLSQMFNYGPPPAAVPNAH